MGHFFYGLLLHIQHPGLAKSSGDFLRCFGVSNNFAQFVINTNRFEQSGPAVKTGALALFTNNGFTVFGIFDFTGAVKRTHFIGRNIELFEEGGIGLIRLSALIAKRTNQPLVQNRR